MLCISVRLSIIMVGLASLCAICPPVMMVCESFSFITATASQSLRLHRLSESGPIPARNSISAKRSMTFRIRRLRSHDVARLRTVPHAITAGPRFVGVHRARCVRLLRSLRVLARQVSPPSHNPRPPSESIKKPLQNANLTCKNRLFGAIISFFRRNAPFLRYFLRAVSSSLRLPLH